MPEIQSVRAAHAVRTLFLVFDKYQVLHVIKLTDQSNLQTYYLKTDAKIAFFAPRRKILLRKHEKQVCKRLRKKSGMPWFLQCAFPNAGIKRESVGKHN